jgi:hypothetical protein
MCVKQKMPTEPNPTITHQTIATEKEKDTELSTHEGCVGIQSICTKQPHSRTCSTLGVPTFGSFSISLSLRSMRTGRVMVHAFSPLSRYLQGIEHMPRGKVI